MRGDKAVDQITEDQWTKLTGRQDPWDIIVEGWLIDVKSSPPPFVMLWPLSKNDIWFDKHFDLMMSVSVDDDDRTRCWIDGFTTKDAFYRHKLVAGPDTHKKLIRGTWYMEKRNLHVITGDGPLLRRIALRTRMDELVKKTIATGLARTGRMARYCKCCKPGVRFEDDQWWCADHKDMSGFVGYDADGNFIHYCHCGKLAGNGYGVRLLKDQLGEWFCDEHKPPKEQMDEAPQEEATG
jgi:hypothetical protein